MNIDKFLKGVQKPARYCGGEFNTPDMTKSADLNFCMCFPDTYEIAMSNLGLKILYHMLNSKQNVVCQRCFAPWVDAAQLLQQLNMPLFSLETHTPLAEFDMLGFSFQYEMGYSNLLMMLKLANIPFYADKRDDSYPILIAGGPCMVNPHPIAAFFDLIAVGDGENLLNQVADLYIDCKKKGINRKEFLKLATKIEGIYVPSLNNKVARRIEKDLDNIYAPTNYIVPNIEVVHDRAVVELFRGCSRGCRFCQAGIIYRPVRERSIKRIIELSQQAVQSCGYEELSLSSLSTGDYSQIKELVQQLKPLSQNNVTLSLPSLRVDSFGGDITENQRKVSLTFAAEAGSQRLRDVINKNITESEILSATKNAFNDGYSSIKLYFMIGLPTETMQDIEGIVKMATQIRSMYRTEKRSAAQLKLSVSVSTFIPKPFTPFQWEQFDSYDNIKQKQAYLAAELKRHKISFSYNDYNMSKMEAILARGDSRLAEVLVEAHNNGACFDSWSDQFDYNRYQTAFEKLGIEPDDYLRQRDTNETLAWDNVDIGVTKQYLIEEQRKSRLEQTTNDCRQGCNDCGITAVEGLCK